jgi:hypothetical protein
MGVFTSPEFLARYNARFPDKPLVYSVYVWSGWFITRFITLGYWQPLSWPLVASRVRKQQERLCSC